MMVNIQALQQQDSTLFELIQKEETRQKQGLCMIPSENIVSNAVREALSSVCTNKYSEGYPKKRYYTGNQFIDSIEQLAIDRAKNLFGVSYVNVQPLSGSIGNMACYNAVLEKNDLIMTMDLAHGGHLTHGSPVNFSGKEYRVVHYRVQKDTEQLDMDVVADIAKRHAPKLILSGFTAYPRTIDFTAFATIAREVGAIAMADISHIAGLIVAGAHASPFPTHDMVMSTTHKTLRGPRGAIILTNNSDIAKKVNKAVFPGLQGGPFEHAIAAKAVAFKEAATPAFKTYAHQIVKNAQALAATLINNKLRLVSGGTDNHLMLIDCTTLGMSGKEGANLLAHAEIYTNMNMIPYDLRTPMDPSGIRLGTPSLTTRGMKEQEMEEIGLIIAGILKKEIQIEHAKKRVLALTACFE